MIKRKWYLIAFAVSFLVLNPIVIGFSSEYFGFEEEMDQFAVGAYAVAWAVLGGWVFIPMLLKPKKQEEEKIRTFDDIIDDAWKEYEEDKERTD